MTHALRPATVQDRKFVEDVYLTTQRWILEALFGVRGDDVERAHFAEEYDRENTRIVVCNGVDAGWITVQVFPGHRYVHSVHLLPAHQNRGIGTALIEAQIEDARRAGSIVRISTAKINVRARHLYERLGFRPLHEGRYKVYLQHDAGQPPAETAIRLIEERDFERLKSWFADPAFVTWWGGKPKPGDEVAEKYLNRRPDVRSFLVVHAGVPAGYLQWWAPAPRTAGLDIVLAPEFQGRGIGIEALRILALSLQSDGWPTITIDPNAENCRAIRAFERAGFQRFAEQSDPVVVLMAFTG